MQSHEELLKTERQATVATVASSNTEHQSSTPIEAWPAASHRYSGIGVILMGLLLSWGLSTAPTEDLHSLWWLTVVMPSPLLFLGAALLHWQLRTRIVADAEGLRWRSLGNWRRSRWDEVTDFHHETDVDGSAVRWQVETPAGNLAFAKDYPGSAMLQQAVLERATSARARTWGKKGIRAEDPWPRTFCYNFPSERKSPWFMGSLVVFAVGLQLLWVGPLTVSTAAEVGWPMALAQLLTATATMVALFGCVVLVTVPAVRETGRRRDDRITVDQHGIRYSAPDREVTARWDEVTDYHVASSAALIKSGGRYVVTTRNGTFDFTPSLGSWLQLRELIRIKAASAASKRWSEDVDERLGSKAQCWSGEHPGVGQRVFHFRTRSNRAGVACLVFAWIVIVISAAFGPLGEHWSTAPAYPLIMIGVLSFAMIWSHWRYRASAILVDEYGLTQRAWNGDRFMRWTDIEELLLADSESLPALATVRGNGKRIRFWLAVADPAELKDEISRRAVNVSGGWKT